MNDIHETDFIPMEPGSPALPLKWLRILFYIHLGGIALSVITMLPINDSFATWISRAITLAAAFCLFRLAPASERYKKAAVFSAVSLGLTLLSSLLLPSLLKLAASILSILATYQEYSGHSDAVSPADPQLSRKWHSLFNWQLFLGVLTAFVSMVAVFALIALELNASLITALVAGALSLMGIALSILYLVYLHRMIKLFSE